MTFPLIKTAKPVSPQCLHHADINVGIVMAHERGAVERNEITNSFNVKIEQFLAQCRRQIGFGVEQERSNIVLKRPFSSALVVQKEWLTFAQHDVARLKIPIQEEIRRRAQQECRELPEIIFQQLLVERDPRQLEKIILKIIQIPGDRLLVKLSARITRFVI